MLATFWSGILGNRYGDIMSMNTPARLFTVFFLLVTQAFATAAPIPDFVNACVAFIYVRRADGKFQPKGTGFFMEVKNQDTGDTAVYLLTAKHVLQQDDLTTVRDSIILRLNRHDGQSRGNAVEVHLKGQRLFASSDESIDLAVVSFTPDSAVFDYKALPSKLLAGNDEIQVGANVFFAAMFLEYQGDKRNEPIVRFGRVALIPKDKVKVSGRPLHVYLIEANSYEGNSGAPIFAYLGSDQPVLKLAGVMVGAFNLPETFRLSGEEEEKVLKYENLGIAAVVPAYKVHELLEEVKKAREQTLVPAKP